MLHPIDAASPRVATSLRAIRDVVEPDATIHVIIRAVVSRRGQRLIDVIYILGKQTPIPLGADVATALGCVFDYQKRGFFMLEPDIEPAIRLIGVALFGGDRIKVQYL